MDYNREYVWSIKGLYRGRIGITLRRGLHGDYIGVP